MKKFPADEEAMKQLLQKLKKKIVENLQLKDVISDELADDTLFFDGGPGLDPTDLLALTTSVDRDNGVEIFHRDLGKKVFITLTPFAMRSQGVRLGKF